ncbi:RagB/SusD family nutrient uptake outer membrane protein [Pedobacter psychroterrae]|uniref:RagB/SusD family nutrient uptake outer membrane protein n=1 Tax=Pedobacter psychroterrae TaxID=2530453 RepID=A0A4R0NMU9_9SPHI|nr:RagB/SusD family nutrient uptake outer membrane protein [Pedobacter psychroterrae]TCD01559.1 RagB/SusD family nutrient uptake outer membrane protein [Pedobacter psychroterrae]
MKIKNTNYIFLIVLLICGSCQKLDRELDTDLTKDQLETTFNSLQSLLTGVYSTLPYGLTQLDRATMASATDEAEFTNEINRVQLINQGAWTATNNPADVWGAFYQGIRRANLFLETADPAKVNLDIFKGTANYQIRIDEIKRWEFEARFLRAFYYFELTKRYGGVPIITDLVDENDVANLKRSTLEECIKFIVDECDVAAAGLPVSSGAYATVEQGRATKAAALALKSRVLLYAASDLFNNASWAAAYAQPQLISLPAGDRELRWKAAADAAKAVIDLQAVPVLNVNTNYRTLFTTPYATGVIFARRTEANNEFELANFSVGFDRGQGGITPSQNLVDDYEIRIGTTWVDFDWNDATHRAAPYANRDPRLALTVVTNGSSFQSRAVPIQTFPGGVDGAPKPNATKTGYYLRKYVNESTNLTTGVGNAVHSWIYFRIEEIFLNYAEALNEYAPGNANIKVYYDRVRTRAGVGLSGLSTAETQTKVRDRIRRERRIEFAFEDHRAWDTRRWMTATTVLNTPLRGINVANTSPAPTYTPFDLEARAFTPKMYLFPIPLNELNIAKGLVQNPLW